MEPQLIEIKQYSIVTKISKKQYEDLQKLTYSNYNVNEACSILLFHFQVVDSSNGDFTNFTK